MTLILFLIGLVLLVVGAEMLVRGASRLALAAGISPLVIGLTVVALGTSSPEMAVSVGGALAGESDIAVGNVVGSNILNVLLILGISALITPLVVHRQLVRIDVPIMIGISAAVWAMGYDGAIGTVDGLILLGAMVGYFALAVRLGRREGVVPEDVPTDRPRGAGQMLTQAAIILVGLALLVLGARWLVGGAVALAESLGIDELVIALTVVAAGTSLPEIATSIVAAVRGQRDMAVGNIVGSNILNLVAILGASAVAAPDGLTVQPAVMWFDFPVMVAVALGCAPIFFTGHMIARWEGAVFLAYYVVYTAYVVLLATEHAALHTLQWALVVFAIPITALTLAVTTTRSVKHRLERRRGGA